LQALTSFLNQAGRVDLNRVLVLRTVSNYDREAPRSTPARALKSMVGGKYRAYSACRSKPAEICGDKVVRDLVEHWGEQHIDDSSCALVGCEKSLRIVGRAFSS